MREAVTGCIELMNHHYWIDKAQFLYEVDRYPGWVVFAVEGGRFSYKIGEKEDEATFGDWVFCPPQTDFYRHVMEPLSFHFLWIEWSEAPSIIPSGKITISNTERLSSTYRYMKLLNDAVPLPTLQWKNRLVQDAWDSFILQHLYSLSSQIDHLMASARKYIAGKAFAPLSLRQIAENFGLSPVQFTRRFKYSYGQTPSQYLQQLRLDHSKALLTETRLSIDDIAVRCGYDNGFYFSRVFAKNYEMSPSQFRNLHRL